MWVTEVRTPRDFSAVELPEFSLTFGGLEAEGGVQGTLGEKPRLTGRIATNTFDPRALLAAVGIAAPATTDADALGKLQFLVPPAR